MKRLCSCIPILIASLCASACDAQIQSQDISRMISTELPLGSSKARIERFFVKHKLEFTYVDHVNKYVSGIRTGSSGIYIELYLDDRARAILE
jgi:hypothetical protein